jgi:hypothetical protein
MNTTCNHSAGQTPNHHGPPSILTPPRVLNPLLVSLSSSHNHFGSSLSLPQTPNKRTTGYGDTELKPTRPQSYHAESVSTLQDSPKPSAPSPLQRIFKVLATTPSLSSLFGNSQSSISQPTSPLDPLRSSLSSVLASHTRHHQLGQTPTRHMHLGHTLRDSHGHSPETLQLNFSNSANINMIHSNANGRNRSPFRAKQAGRGTTSWQLKEFAEATLGSGSLRKAVKLPEGEDEDEWLAVNGKSILDH